MKVSSVCRSCGKPIPEALASAALCVECRYSDAPPARAWNDDARGYAPPRQFLGSVGFVYPAESDEPPPDRDAAQTLLAEFLASFAQLSPESAGRRVQILAYLAGKTDFKTDAELARHFGISATRFSHLKREFSPTFASLYRLGQRQKERQKRNVAPRVNEHSI